MQCIVETNSAGSTRSVCHERWSEGNVEERGCDREPHSELWFHELQQLSLPVFAHEVSHVEPPPEPASLVARTADCAGSAPVRALSWSLWSLWLPNASQPGKCGHDKDGREWLSNSFGRFFCWICFVPAGETQSSFCSMSLEKAVACSASSRLAWN